MEVLGLITARGGSKGIPHKNMAMVAGRPLLAYTCEAALGSRRLSRVVLSTDDDEIASAGGEMGVEVPFLRPGDLSTDEATSLDVVRHAVDWLDRHQDWLPGIVVLLQPTSPLRSSRHIDDAVGLLEATGADTIVSVVEVQHQFSPSKLMRCEGDRLVPFRDGDAGGRIPRRQDLPRLFARNGPAVLATRVEHLRAGHGFYDGVVAPLVMTKLSSVDIDDLEDLRVAEALIRDDVLDLIAKQLRKAEIS